MLRRVKLHATGVFQCVRAQTVASPGVTAQLTASCVLRSRAFLSSALSLLASLVTRVFCYIPLTACTVPAKCVNFQCGHSDRNIPDAA